MAAGDSARGPARVNRIVLALVGLVLIAAGAAALAVGAGVFGAGPARAELFGGPVAAWLGRPWAPYALAAAAIIVALLALRWLTALGGTDTVGRLRMETEAAPGTIEMPAAVARGALEEQVGRYPGVRRVRANLAESRHDPSVRLDLTLNADADVADVWRRCRGEAIEQLRGSLEVDRLPAVIRMSMTAPPKNPRRELA
ncbi:hypothetical protein CLV63_11821 [Murinocardiopsis flavida]|uniref:Uncharacterized protein n=1 Tax=Murinocardiopsis flavida TaxID=645275 RepID=A0A2P8D4X2_9ACTN|nr:alkaline shock response membrane anchor protein AmaP [Murinocardiopsis flavida]PSK92264.1 hypothetical protein CLV63_11821 [Murinocardiopsis flavida]